MDAELNRPIAATHHMTSISPIPTVAKPLLPSFLATARNEMHESSDDIQEAALEDTEEPHIAGDAQPSSRHRSPSPTPTPRSNRKKGPLAKRMRDIRDATKGDQIRLQSGQYPLQTTTTTTDRNDPRNRATSMASVTVLGTPVPLDRHVTSTLCYLHEWQSRSAGPPTAALVWMVSHHDTTTSNELRPQAQLRLYNAIAVQCREDKWVLFHADIREPAPPPGDGR